MTGQTHSDDSHEVEIGFAHPDDADVAESILRHQGDASKVERHVTYVSAFVRAGLAQTVWDTVTALNAQIQDGRAFRYAVHHPV